MLISQKPLNSFISACVAAGLPPPLPEYKFCTQRNWRFDFAWPVAKIALEVEGGVWTRGRHTRGSGFVQDMDKYNSAAILGWRLIRVTPQQMPVMAILLAGDALRGTFHPPPVRPAKRRLKKIRIW